MSVEPRPPAPAVVAIPSLLQLGRRAIPQAVEAAIVPAILFLVFARLVSASAGIGAALGWAAAAIAWRLVTRRRVPGMMVLAVVTLLARSVLALAAGSTFLYFLQPTIGAFGLAAAFLVSVILNRPLARRFAGDFCALPREIVLDARVHHLFRRISVMWGAIGLLNAGVALWLLVTQTTLVYVVTKTALSIAVTVVAVAISVVWFRRSISRHGLVAVVS
jgi:intracellular septation protein A